MRLFEIADNNSEPTLFHGSENPNKTEFRVGEGEDIYGKGVYVTTSRNYASQYGPNIYNVGIVGDVNMARADDTIKQEHIDILRGITPADESPDNILKIKDKVLRVGDTMAKTHRFLRFLFGKPKVNEIMGKLGYDAFAIPATGGWTIVIFNADNVQIIS